MPESSSFCQIFITHSAKETQLFAKVLAKFLSAGSVIRLEGDLGAGKTQFTQGLAKGLGITEAITSPTFALMNHYPSGQGGRLSLNHFDLYRLSSEDELEDIAFWETIESDAITCIEWSNLFPDAMPEEALCVLIEKIDASLSIPDETRRITLFSPESSFDQFSEAFETAKANQ